MFNLITVIFSIVLVAVMAGASIYYGGDVITTKTHATDYAAIANGAIQIKASMELYRSRTGGYPGGVTNESTGASATEELLTRLVDESYLASRPAGDWTIENLMIQAALADVETCARTNKFAGMQTSSVPDGSGCPTCADAAYYHWPACKAS